MKNNAWRKDYNEHRPHSALNDQTPSEFAENFDLSRAVEKVGFFTLESVEERLDHHNRRGF